jgi:hypothetical protein
MMGIAAGVRDEKLQRSSHMADQQDRPDEVPDAAPEVPAAAKPPIPPAAKRTPAKAAKRAPAKAAKKAPAKKAPAKPTPKTKPATSEPTAAPLADTNGSGKLAEAAREAAAQAKSTVDGASDPVVRPTPLPVPAPSRSRLPLAVAVAITLLAALLARQLRRRSRDEA